MSSQKILLLDIETVTNTARVWGYYEQNVQEILQDWYIIGFSAKWMNEKQITTRVLPDYAGYKKNKSSDLAIMKELHALLSEADVVIAHNGDGFDLKKINSRFIVNGLGPTVPYKTIDTLKICRRVFGFSSNKLDDVARQLGVARKGSVNGFAAWKGCLDDKPKAWKDMATYNKQDVVVLAEVYQKLIPWMPTYPNAAAYVGDDGMCPRPGCGSKKLHKRGTGIEGNYSYQRYQCTKCGGYPRGYNRTKVLYKAT